jgi:hypothetical protein
VEGEEESEGLGEEGEEELAEGLGGFAWNLGVPLILGFVAYKHAYIYAAKRRVKLPVSLKTALEIHVATALVLGAAALIHGVMLIDEAGPVEYAAGGLTALILASGAALYYVKRRQAQRLARMLHVQRALGAALLLVVALHVALAD